MRPVHKEALHQQARGRHCGIMCAPPQDRARRLPAVHAEHRGRAGRRGADAGRRAVDKAGIGEGVHSGRAVLPAARQRASRQGRARPADGVPGAARLYT